MTRLLVVVLLAACGGGPAAVHPTPAPVDDAGAPAVEGPPSEAECDTLLDHVLALAYAENPDPQRTDTNKAKLREDSRVKMMPQCRKMARATYACAIVAPTLATFIACDQTSRSSSTSNSSVAPGGIAPPAAPRSP